MLDINKCKEKSKRKKGNYKGVSVVHFPKNIVLYDAISDLRAQLGKYAFNFEWTLRKSLHLTFIRCESIDVMLTTAEYLVDVLEDAVRNFHVQRLTTSRFVLTNDGIIRLMCSGLERGCYAGFDEGLLYRISNMRYTTISVPWITIAHLKEERIEEVIKAENSIRRILDSYRKKLLIYINTFEIVNYSDTAFREFESVHSWRLTDNESR